MNKIRKGDQVIVLTGRDKGKQGVVSARKDDSHLLIDGINLVKKHVKPNPMKGTTGGIVKRPCLSTNPTWPSSMQRPARPIAWASRCKPTARAFACSSPTAPKSRRPKG